MPDSVNPVFTIDPSKHLIATPSPSCIYCGQSLYRPTGRSKRGEEHVVPEGLGGKFVIPEAACFRCEVEINKFEQSVLRSVLYLPRVTLGVPRKKRKRGPDLITLMATVDGRETQVRLPIGIAPNMMILPVLGAPGITVNRKPTDAEFLGMWFRTLGDFSIPQVEGMTSIASPVLDTLSFCRFLAKIAHCVATAHLGNRFRSALTDFILTGRSDGQYHLIGGAMTEAESAGETLHEIRIGINERQEVPVVHVYIRLFSTLGSPSYWVVAGNALTN